MNKVFGGTPHGTQSLCATCRWAQNMRGVNMQERTMCLRMSPPVQLVTFPIAQCSGYDDKRNPSLQRMNEIAWDIKTSVRPIRGFGEAQTSVEITPPDPSLPRPSLPDVDR